MIHLHVHSHYSLLCGASSPATLVARATDLGFTSLALTDLNNLHGTVVFQKQCAQAGLRPVCGVEITADIPRDTDPVRLIPHSLQPGRPRVVLLARDQAGYAAMCRLTTLRQVRPDFDLLREIPGFINTEGNGIFCLTDSVAVLETLTKAAAHKKSNLVEFTHGSLRVLLTTVGGQLGPVYRNLRSLAQWATACQVPVIAGGDIYAATMQEMDHQRLLSSIRTLEPLESVPDACCAPAGSWLRAANDMRRLLAEFPTACTETLAVADQCRFQHKLGTWRYPQFPLPSGETTASYLWKLCFDGLQKRYRQVSSQAMARLQEEINVVEQLGFAGYFLIVWDIVRYAADHGMPTLGRGSAANSLIAYLLGITHVDPLAHNLYFQRFLNPERISPPDIDLDFGWKDRDQVLEYVYDRYGRDQTAMICNINRFSARSGFRAAATARGYGDRRLSRITRRLPWRLLDEQPAAALARRPESAGLPLDQEPYCSLLRQAQDLARYPRHLGIHAGGLVIADRPLTDLFPLQWARKGILISQLDMYSIEDLGLVKIDLLSQRGLAVVADAARAVGENTGITVDLSKLPDEDPATRRLMSSGRTMGCFYIESPGMRALLKKLKADTFAVVVAASSVIRPGPSDSGMSRSFVLRHLGKEKPVLPHPMLDFLQETYGVMIYQEDVMRTLSAVACLSLGEADLMRRAMSFKGDRTEFLALEEKFLTGARQAMETGHAPRVDPKIINELWRQISSFAGYAFCKAHSASYAVLSFQSAWLKAHYPAEFMAAVMSNGGGFYSTAAYLEEARRLGLRIMLPDINHSEDVFTGRNRELRIGLQQIAGMSRRSLEALLSERRRNGFFISLRDLMRRVLPLAENEVGSLVRCGACDGFELSRPELLWRHALLRKERRDQYDLPTQAARHALPQAETNDSHRPLPRPTTTLFPTSESRTAISLVPTIPDSSTTEKLRQEMEVLDLAVSHHPLATLRPWLQQQGVILNRDLGGWSGKRVKVAGIIITAKSATVRSSGQPMKFLTLEDETDICEVTLFPRIYARYGARLLSRGPYLVTGVVEDDHGSLTVTAEGLEII